MATRFYRAYLEPAADGGYGVYFPDLPGCTSGGDTMEEAAENAFKALAFHVAGLAEDGEEIPPPRPPRRSDLPEGCTLAMVPVNLPGKVVRLNITMDEGTLAIADRLAADRGTTRSGLFADLVRKEAAPAVLAKGRRSKLGPSRLRTRLDG